MRSNWVFFVTTVFGSFRTGGHWGLGPLGRSLKKKKREREIQQQQKKRVFCSASAFPLHSDPDFLQVAFVAGLNLL